MTADYHGLILYPKTKKEVLMVLGAGCYLSKPFKLLLSAAAVSNNLWNQIRQYSSIQTPIHVPTGAGSGGGFEKTYRNHEMLKQAG